MSESIDRLLNRCRPLSDPVAAYIKAMIWSARIVSVILPAIAILPILTSGELKSPATLVTLAVFVLFWVGILVSVSLFTSPFRKILRSKKVLVLRSFSQDLARSENRIRRTLASALPPGYTLSGIRAPQLRVPLLIRLWS
ncbi:MAG: hypothetical protein AAF191_10375, partial [Verrucomicrobiota bacterium]